MRLYSHSVRNQNDKSGAIYVGAASMHPGREYDGSMPYPRYELLYDAFVVLELPTLAITLRGHGCKERFVRFCFVFCFVVGKPPAWRRCVFCTARHRWCFLCRLYMQARLCESAAHVQRKSSIHLSI